MLILYPPMITHAGQVIIFARYPMEPVQVDRNSLQYSARLISDITSGPPPDFRGMG